MIIEQKFLQADIRVTVDGRSEKVGAKIRDAELKKIPIMLIIGEREAADNTASVRRRHSGDLGIKDIESLISELREEIQSRRRS